MKFSSIRIEINDSRGASSIALEKLPFTKVQEKVQAYLDYVLKDEEGPMDIRLESTKGKESIERSLEDLDPEEVKHEVSHFLRYVYGLEGPIEGMVLGFKDPGKGFRPSWLEQRPEELTQKEKVFLLLKHAHPDDWVRSQDIQMEYEIVYGEEISLSSVSTYLARYYNKGYLERRGTRAQREYMLPMDKARA
jgi:hypothetical protein